MSRYLNLKGTFKDYGVEPFRTASISRNSKVVQYHMNVNRLFSKFESFPTTSTNLEFFFNEIGVLNRAFEKDRNDKKYNEIYNHLETISNKFGDEAERVFNELPYEEKEKVLAECRQYK